MHPSYGVPRSDGGGGRSFSKTYGTTSASVAPALDVPGATKVRRDISVALSVLSQSETSWAYPLLTARDTNARLHALSNPRALPHAASWRAISSYLGDEFSSPDSQPLMTSILDAVVVPSYSVSMPGPSGEAVSCTVGGAVAEVLNNAVLGRDVPLADLQRSSGSQVPDFFTGFFIQNDFNGERLLVLHGWECEGSNVAGQTMLLHSSYLNTTTRRSVIAVLNTDYFHAGLFDSATYFTRSFMQPVPCVKCGNQSVMQQCSCSGGFPPPRHPFDFSLIPKIVQLHCVRSSGPVSAAFVRNCPHFEIPVSLKRYQAWWESFTTHDGPGTLTHSPLMTAMTRYQCTAFTQQSGRGSQLIQRAIQVMGPSGVPMGLSPIAGRLEDRHSGAPSWAGEQVAFAPHSEQAALGSAHGDAEGFGPGEGTWGTMSPSGNEADRLDDEERHAREERNRKRRQRNRESAAKSNAIRKERNEKLKRDVDVARRKIAGLVARQQELARENLELKSRASALWKQQVKGGRSSGT